MGRCDGTNAVRLIKAVAHVALAGIAVANVSGMSKGEVERIWLPAVPFLLLACSVFPTRSERRAWVGVQLGLGIVMQLVIRSPW